MSTQELSAAGDDASHVRGQGANAVRGSRDSAAQGGRATHSGGRGNNAINIEEAIRLYVDEKQTLPEIAVRFGVSKQAVGQALEGAGVERRSKEEARALTLEKRFPEDFRAQALKRASEVGITRAAAELHISRQTLKGWGARGRKPTRPTLKWSEIARMYKEDLMSPYEISKVAGIHPNVIAATLRRGGMKMRTKSEANRLAMRKRKVETDAESA